jgi:heptaprenyl diphosphate synthase
MLSYDDALETTRNEVKRVLSRSPMIIREYTGHLSETTGKFIRAKSLLACALDEKDTVLETAVNFAAAIEILHLATLVHDDVIDDADLRRGMESLQKKFGVRTAVICGDYLLSVAFRLIASVPEDSSLLERNLPDFLGRISLGELNQHINNGNYNLTVLQYLRIISGKTAAMFEASFYIGAALVEKEETTVKKYAKVGRYAGMIFQLTDDCMDFEITKQVARKPVQSDYEQDVVTLPLIHAFRTITGLREKACKRRIPRREINSAVKKAGGVPYAQAIAGKYYKKALVELEDLEMTEYKRNAIEKIVNKAKRVF